MKLKSLVELLSFRSHPPLLSYYLLSILASPEAEALHALESSTRLNRLDGSVAPSPWAKQMNHVGGWSITPAVVRQVGNQVDPSTSS